ncbi:MAG: glycosyltransferase family 4 protein [Patescibacteria group bacterium]
MKNVLIMKFPLSSMMGGGERHTLSLVNALQQKDFNFFLVSSCRVLLSEFKKNRWPGRRWWGGVEPVSVSRILIWPLVAPFACISLGIILLYYRLAKKVTVLYCLSLTEKILATLPARMLGMKVIWVEHVTLERWLDQNPLKFLYRWFSGAVAIIAVSRAIKDQLINTIHVHGANVSIIYNGVDLKKFTVKERRWEQSARFNIGCVARLEPEKGVEFLIQSVKIIQEFIPFARLIIVGEGSERKKLMWLSDRLGLKETIQWVGYQREVDKWYSYFDALVLPSVRRESFGITLVEAMASGIPVVGTRLGGIPEIIEHQQTGLLAKPGDSQDMADQLIYLFNHRAESHEMVERARQKVEVMFSQERMVRDYYLLLRK